jgi:hypothetical protein
LPPPSERAEAADGSESETLFIIKAEVTMMRSFLILLAVLVAIAGLSWTVLTITIAAELNDEEYETV